MVAKSGWISLSPTNLTPPHLAATSEKEQVLVAAVLLVAVEVPLLAAAPEADLAHPVVVKPWMMVGDHQLAQPPNDASVSCFYVLRPTT